MTQQEPVPRRIRASGPWRCAILPADSDGEAEPWNWLGGQCTRDDKHQSAYQPGAYTNDEDDILASGF